MASFDKEKVRLGSFPVFSISYKSVCLERMKESLIPMKNLRVHSLGVHFLFSSLPQESWCSHCFSWAAGERIPFSRRILKDCICLQGPLSFLYDFHHEWPFGWLLVLVLLHMALNESMDWKSELGLPNCGKDGNWELRVVSDHYHYSHYPWKFLLLISLKWDEQTFVGIFGSLYTK